MLPIHWNLRKSVVILSDISLESPILPKLKMSMTVPSRGAAVSRYCALLRPAAPGMFCTTMVGFSRDVAADVTREQSRVDVEAAARREAHDDRQRLAAVEILSPGGRVHAQTAHLTDEKQKRPSRDMAQDHGRSLKSLLTYSVRFSLIAAEKTDELLDDRGRCTRNLR